MASIRVTHTIGDLASDLAAIPPVAVVDMAETVRKNVDGGLAYARGYARSSSGIHGKAYYKRITAEMTGAMTGEFGPHGDVRGNAVGGGWRHGPPNTDLDRAADLIGPKFARDVAKLPDRWFW